MQSLAPIGCCACSCRDAVEVQIVGGTGCSLQGTVAPEGAVTADVGCWYRLRTDTAWEIWYKDDHNGSPYGWTLFVKLL